MSIWVQHGHGKSDKIERLRTAGLLAGVVLSPANEDAAGLRDLASSLLKEGVATLLDPQAYIYTIAGSVPPIHHSHNQLNMSGVHWSADPQTVDGHLDQVIAANRKLGIQRVVAPTPLQGSFSDVWSPLALQYARGASTSIGGDHVYVSVVVDEAGLDDWQAIDEWLDVATTLDVRGFYLIVARSTNSYPSAWRPARLTNLLRLIFRLSRINEYDVVLGYSELEGLASVALGANMATGWTHGLRRFHEGRWKPSPGGGPPAPRIFCKPLLVPLLVGDARAVMSRAPDLVSDDANIRQSLRQGSWGLTEARLQYLTAMGELASALTARKPDERIEAFSEMVLAARKHLAAQTQLASRPSYDALLAPFTIAVAELRKTEGLGP